MLKKKKNQLAAPLGLIFLEKYCQWVLGILPFLWKIPFVYYYNLQITFTTTFGNNLT